MAARALALALILFASAVALAGLYEALLWLKFQPPARGIVGQLRPIIIVICLLVAMAGLFTFLICLATAALSAPT
jgi:di/tricarboxylate transporter